jgi:hypothetical protein
MFETLVARAVFGPGRAFDDTAALALLDILRN